MTTYSVIREQDMTICAACGNGMPGFDAPKTAVSPVDGRDNDKNKEKTGQSPWSYHT